MNKTAISTNIFLVAASLCSIFLVGEITLRLIGFNPYGQFLEKDGRSIFIQASRNPQRIYEAKPNAQGYGWETDVSINSYGFRGPEFSIEKPPGTKRIVVIGDSITFGNRLKATENYPAQLQQLYAQNNKPVEVFNLGLGGYDTLQAVATLKDIGLQFKPDLVVLGYCINDIGIASGNADYIERLQEYHHPLYTLRTAQFIRIQLDRIILKQQIKQQNSKEFFQEKYSAYMTEISGDETLLTLKQKLQGLLDHTENRAPFSLDYTDDSKLKRLRFSLEQMKQLQYENGQKQFDVVVLIFPFLLENEDNAAPLNVIYEMISHESLRLGFQVINLNPVFSSRGFNHLLIKHNDGIHPNAEGHSIAAQKLLDTIPMAVSEL